MDTLIVYLTNESSLLFKWQDLFGSIIGVIGAFLVALGGFLLNQLYQKRRERRESIRQTEIALALGLNDIYDAERHLSEFLGRLNRSVIQPLQQNQNPSQYFLSRTNFPPLSIHIDSSLLKAKHRSYYIHNKVLIIYKNIEQANRMFSEMKMEYGTIFETAKYLIDRGALIDNQRREYLANNENFRNFINDTINQLQAAKKVFAQTKVYNLKLLNRQWFSTWRLEGTSFKFFCCKEDIEKYKSTLRCLDRIDKKIDAEVTELMKKAEERRNSPDQDEPRRSFWECIKSAYKWTMEKILRN